MKADNILDDINSSVIYQDVDLGNAKLKYEFTRDWSIGHDFVSIRVSQNVLGSRSIRNRNSLIYIHDFELQTIDGTRYIRYNPYNIGKGESRRILIDYGFVGGQFVIDAGAINIEHNPGSIFVIGAYIDDGRRIVLFQGATPGSARHAFKLLQNITEDIDIDSFVTRVGGADYQGEWYNGEQLADTIWVEKKLRAAITVTDPLDGENDGWAVADEATQYLLDSVDFHEPGFESAELSYRVDLPPESVDRNLLYLRYSMKIVVDSETKGFRNFSGENSAIGLPNFEVKVENDTIYIRRKQ